MSRIRMGAVLALGAGILISTGGCAESPTTVEATPTTVESTDAQQNSGWMTGGGRADMP